MDLPHEPPTPVVAPEPAAPRGVVRGMATYFTEVADQPLGVSELDFLLLNVPPVCNYRCRKCFTGIGERKVVDPLPLPEWRRLVAEARDLGAKNVSILGEGEPLFYPSVREVVRDVHAAGMIPMLATNARELTPAMSDFLVDHGATVGFSLDTLDPAEYADFCRGNADLKEVLDNIAYARRRFAETIEVVRGNRVFRFLLHMTVTPQNFHHLSALRAFCGDDILFDAQPLANVGVAEDHGDYFGEGESYERFAREGHASSPPMVLTTTADGREVCCLFNFGIAVNHSGDVMFDTHAVEPVKYIGNVRGTPLSELVARVRALREFFLERYPSAGYCPVRDDATYKDFIALTTQRSIHELLWR